MRKTNLFILLMSMVVLTLVSCKKDETDNTGSGDNYYKDVFWKLGTTEYKLQTASRVKRETTDVVSLVAAGINGTEYCSFSLNFKEFPTTSKTYKVNKSMSLRDGDCSIACVTMEKGLVETIFDEGAVVNITVKDGKISTEFSNLKARSFPDGDDYLISGKIYE